MVKLSSKAKGQWVSLVFADALYFYVVENHEMQLGGFLRGRVQRERIREKHRDFELM